MIKQMDVTPEIAAALAALRIFAGDESRNSLNTVSAEAARAINVLDNAGVFAEIDERYDYAAPLDVLQEVAEELIPNTLDPAEWGDTTSADVARRSGLLLNVGDQHPVYIPAMDRVGRIKYPTADGADGIHIGQNDLDH